MLCVEPLLGNQDYPARESRVYLFSLASIASKAATSVLRSDPGFLQIRGTLGSLNQLVICIGILFALLVNVLIPPANWRYMFYIAVVPAVLLTLGEPSHCCWLLVATAKTCRLTSATHLCGLLLKCNSLCLLLSPKAGHNHLLFGIIK